MNIDRRAFLGGALATVASLALTGCDAAGEAEKDVTEVVERDYSLTFKPASLDDYSFRDLSELAQAIHDASSEAEGYSLAQEYGLMDDKQAITDQVMRREMTDGTVLELRVVGILHDDLSDGSGKSGVTLFCDQAPDTHVMNLKATEEGGWEASELNGWLRSDLEQRLPEGMLDVLRPVVKKTNNTGVKATVGDVTGVEDTLWLASATEVCGEISWFKDEYGSDQAQFDDVLNAEGEQYAWFAQNGVTDDSDPENVLAKSCKGKPVGWWYRSPFPFVYQNVASGYFYGAMQSGSPKGFWEADDERGVVFGCCL